MFAYCNNNPVNRSDPTGNLPDWVYKYFGTEWNYYNYIRVYGYDKLVEPLATMGFDERDYHVPSNATNVSVTLISGTDTRSMFDVIKDRLGGVAKEGLISFTAELFLQPVVSHTVTLMSLVYGLFADEDKIPHKGKYATYTIILRYDKADEVSGENIYFYNEATYLIAYTSAGEKYLYRDSGQYYSYPAIMNKG